MKGFIEIQATDNKNYIININHILRFTDSNNSGTFMVLSDKALYIKESVNEIKQKIKDAV